MSREEITRRDFLVKLSAATGLTIGAGAFLSACGGGESGQATTPAAQEPAGAMAAACDDLSGLTDADKQLRSTLQYVDKTANPDRHCSNCALFVAPADGASCGTCSLIKGPIAPGGYCSSWAPKPA